MPSPDCAEAAGAFDPASRPDPREAACEDGRAFRPITDPRIVAAMRFAEARIDAPVTTSALAAAVGLSQFHFLRLFQAQTGEAVSDYVRRIRLDAAALHLRGSAEPIVSIALSVGYGSQAAFTRAFTGRFGRSPASYRRGAGREPAADAGRLRTIAVRRVAAVACIGRRYLGLRRGGSEQWRDFLRHLPSDPAARSPCRLLRIVRDDPRITPPEQIRVDCCVVGADRPGESRDLAERGFQPFTMEAGTYAVIPRAGTDADCGAAEHDLLDGWLARHGRYRLRGAGRLEFQLAPEAPARAGGEVLVPIRTVGSEPG